jgi:3-hydroxyisobutyrate dehydrogenase-like beta-hydroxyacid dehydrogenase
MSQAGPFISELKMEKTMPLPKLGFAGVGRMGAPMARRLMAAGYELSVFDASASAVAALVAEGARAAETPAILGRNADIVFLSLPTPEIAKAVALGDDGLVNSEGLRIVIDLSTTGPRVEREIAAGLAKANIKPVDCPVSGGVAGAEKGTLALMAACHPDVFAEIEPILLTLGKTFYIGEEPGMGQMIKVINNLMSVTSLTIASEALVLGVKAGLDPEVMLKVINAGSGSTNATLDKIPKYVIGRGFDFGFAIGLSAKDARLCLEESEALGVPMVVGSAVRQMINITKGRLGADADLTEIIKPIEEWAGVTVSSPKDSR